MSGNINTNTVTPNSGVAVKTKEMLWFEKDLIEEAVYEKASKFPTFPYVITKKGQVKHYTFARRGDNTFYFKQFLCSNFKIEEVYRSEKNGNVMYLTIKALKDGKWYEHKEVPLSYFSTTNMHELKKYGIVYNTKLKNDVENFASMLIDNKSMTHKTDKLGWHGDNIEEIHFYGFDKKSYEGTTPLMLSGSFEKQIECVNSCIKHSVACQLAVAISLSSALLVLLRHSNIAIDPAAYHFFGTSSTGKTTALKLAVSMWTNPLVKGLMTSWNSTHNGLMATLNNNFGATLCLDEIGISTQNLTEFIYSLSQGSDKVRCSPSGILPTKTWCTNIISTGEMSFSSKVGGQAGMNARIIEFMDLTLTNSNQHAEEIQYAYTRYYGYIGKEFVTMLPTKFSQLSDDFNRILLEILQKLPSGNINERVAKQYACVCLAAEYAQAMGIFVEPEKIQELLIENHQDSRPSYEIAYNSIMDYVKQNPSKYPHAPSEYGSKIDGYYLNSRLVIFKDSFDDIIKGLQLDSKIIVKEFDRIGVLEHEKDRLSKRLVLNGSKHTVYIIRTDYDIDDGEVKKLETVSQGTKPTIVSSTANITGCRRKEDNELSA